MHTACPPKRKSQRTGMSFYNYEKVHRTARVFVAISILKLEKVFVGGKKEPDGSRKNRRVTINT